MASENPPQSSAPQESSPQAAIRAERLMMEALEVLDQLQMPYPAVHLCHALELLSAALGEASSFRPQGGVLGPKDM